MKTKPTTTKEYHKRMNMLTEYIHLHLADELSVDVLASVCNFSPYHFHRITRAFLGEPIGSYILRLRAEKAAYALKYTEQSVQDIAYNVGYNSPSSLTKVFNQYYQLSPTLFRKQQKDTTMKTEIDKEGLNVKGPKIIEVTGKTALYIRLTGSYSGLDYGAAWEKLWGQVKVQKLFGKGIEHICIYHDDPQITKSAKLRTDVCLVICKPAEPNGEIGVKEIAGGVYAMFLYQGSYDRLGEVYDYIYGTWLPQSGMQLRDVPGFEKYVSNPKMVAPEKLKTEIYIPVQ